MGMRLDSDGYLTVCDATLGIYKINVTTGTLSFRFFIFLNINLTYV